MRVIAGEYRSRILKSLDGQDTRPTLDKIKGAVFSSIGHKILGSSFLDLFAGSGAIGIEAKSRGAKHVILNDYAKKAYEVVMLNLKNLDISDIIVYSLNYRSCLDKLISNDYKFDYVYLDPPFIDIDYHQLISDVCSSSLLHEKSKVIIESPYQEKLLPKYGDYILDKSMKYGSIKISYYVMEVIND